MLNCKNVTPRAGLAEDLLVLLIRCRAEHPSVPVSVINLVKLYESSYLTVENAFLQKEYLRKAFTFEAKVIKVSILS